MIENIIVFKEKFPKTVCVLYQNNENVKKSWFFTHVLEGDRKDGGPSATNLLRLYLQKKSLQLSLIFV